MSDLAKTNQPIRSKADDLPKLGEWAWVKVEADDDKLEREELACCTHVGSNYAQFDYIEVNSHGDDWTVCLKVHHNELIADVRPEPNWKAILQARIDQKEIELREAVNCISELCAAADLGTHGPEASLLPSTQRRDIGEYGRQLVNIKEKAFPDSRKNIERITAGMVALHKMLIMPQRAQADFLNGAVLEVDQRLFALELYAGLAEKVKQIKDGAPAPAETPIAIRQLMLYMDEETLFDLEHGGLDFKKLYEFDRWVARKDILPRMLPEPKSIVAFQIRRHDKDYGWASSFSELLTHAEWNKQNRNTYLLIRNGQRVYRLVSSQDFRPRLLPFKDEFTAPLSKTVEYYPKGEKFPFGTLEHKQVIITPADLELDKHAKERRDTMRDYNRIMFLLHGLLDRSDVFSPHPPIKLSDPGDLAKWVRQIRDEEDVLPPADPVPTWEEYRDRKNAAIKVGSFIYSSHHPKSDFRWYSYDRKSHLASGRERPSSIMQVTGTRKREGRREYRVSWPWGTRYGYEFDARTVWGRPDGYGKLGEWPVNKLRHCWLPWNEVFNVSAYKPGEHKIFLCDRSLKGSYLEWARVLLAAEKWHNENKQRK